MKAFFTKQNSSWAVKVAGTTRPEPGQAVTVSKKDGSTSTVIVEKILASYPDATVCSFRDSAKPAGSKPTWTPTDEQVVALDKFRTGRSLAIKAGAGTGKTSTLTILSHDADEHGRHGQGIAFNTKIVHENRTSGKFPSSCEWNTAHSLAKRAVGGPFQDRFDAGKRMKSMEIARVLNIDPITVTKWDGEQKTLTPGFLAGLVIKSVMSFCKTADAEPTAKHVPFIDGLDKPVVAEQPRSYVVNREVARALEPTVRKAWTDLTRYNGSLPFTKSIAFSVFLKLWQLSDPRIEADYILFDEAQDANPVMIDVVSKQTHAQLVWVGDDNQQIYSFTGAINALSQVPADEEAMLTQSFRFGQAIADVANEILSTLPTTMRLTGTAKITSVVEATDEPRAILTRTNATALRHVLDALAAGRKPFLVGGGAEVASFCRAAIDLQDGQRTDHADLGCFSSWGEVQEYIESDQQGDDLRLMVRLVDEFTAQAILNAVNSCDKEADADVIVSTAHKSKGLEWDSVKIGADFPEKAKANDEERRLLYVAITRAKITLDITAVAFFSEQVAA